DAVRASVLELQVVAGDARDGLRLEAGEARDAVVLVDDVIPDPQVREGGEAPARRGGRGRSAPVHETPERDDGQLQVGRDEPVGQPGPGDKKGARVGRRAAV